MSDHVTEFAEQGGRTPGKPGRKPRARIDMSDERYRDEYGPMDRDPVEDREDYDDIVELFLATQHQTVLPNLPRMDGYHVCWLTTSNPRDSISWRKSIGYELIRVEDCENWHGAGVQPDASGVVTVNEMVAARIPIRLYNRLENAVGHYLPLKEEEKLRANTDLIQRNARRRNIQVAEGDGMAEIIQRAEPPVFTE